jgi:hypothetical protein
MHINLRNNDKIEGWGHSEDDVIPTSNNMLRIL